MEKTEEKATGRIPVEALGEHAPKVLKAILDMLHAWPSIEENGEVRLILWDCSNCVFGHDRYSTVCPGSTRCRDDLCAEVFRPSGFVFQKPGPFDKPLLELYRAMQYLAEQSLK